MTNKTITDNEVINYLSANKDFFVRHPEQLEALEVSNKNGKVASLINHQVNILKERNNQLKMKLSTLIGFAEENEKTMSQVFELTLQLSQISHVANMTKHFTRFVKQYFDSDLFKMVIPAYDNLDSSSSVLCVENIDSYTQVFGEFSKNNTPICGRLRKEKLEFIFGNQANKIGSTVILPIGSHANKGLLVFASFDEARFNSGMSTDLLARLTQILDRKLKNTLVSKKETKAQ